MPALSLEQVLRLGQRSQRLHSRGPHVTGVAGLVRDVFGLQAQEPSAAALSVRPRTDGLTASAVERARVEERTIVRTWAMRGTLHLMAAQDLGWLLRLLGRVFVRQSARRFAQLGLSDEIYAKALPILRELLGRRGPLTRAELAERLAEQGIPTEGQAIYHLVRRAGLEGVVCFGPDRDGDPTFVLLEDWAETGSAIDDSDALAELTRRYLAAYGPAAPEDFAAWSGLPLVAARAAFDGLAGELLEVSFEGSPLWMPEDRAAWLDDDPAEGPAVARLLPAYDTYLLGYRGRDLMVAPQYAKRIHPGGGVIRATLLLDGRLAGTWSTQRNKDGLLVQVAPFEPLSPAVLPALEEEVRDVGRYLEVEARLALSP